MNYFIRIINYKIFKDRYDYCNNKNLNLNIKWKIKMKKNNFKIL